LTFFFLWTKNRQSYPPTGQISKLHTTILYLFLSRKFEKKALEFRKKKEKAL